MGKQSLCQGLVVALSGQEQTGLAHTLSTFLSRLHSLSAVRKARLCAPRGETLTRSGPEHHCSAPFPQDFYISNLSSICRGNQRHRDRTGHQAGLWQCPAKSQAHMRGRPGQHLLAAPSSQPGLAAGDSYPGQPWHYLPPSLAEPPSSRHAVYQPLRSG